MDGLAVYARMTTHLATVLGLDPNAPAVTDERRTLNWDALDRRSHALARGLERLGVVPGQHVALICSNRVEFVDAVLGVTRGGFLFTPLKTNWTATEVQWLLEDANSAAVITDQEVGIACAAAAGIPCITIDDHFDDWLDTQPADPVPMDRRGGRIPYTSGTTGRPKGVHRTGGPPDFATWLTASAGYTQALGLPGHGDHLMVAQMFHGAPLNFGMSTMFAGAHLRIMTRWHAEQAVPLLAAATSSIMVPTMFRQLLALPEENRAALPGSNLEMVLHGGEACPVPVKQRMIDWWGPIFTEYYGFTEGGMTVCTSEDWLARPGTVGRPGGGIRAMIVDAEGNEAPPNVTGTVYFQREGGRYFRYANDTSKTEAAHRADDSFTVGDHGWLDEDGWLFLAGRTAELIVGAGVNIYPAEIETVISTVAGVVDCCVVAGPHPTRGEEPIAWVVVADLDAAEDTVARAVAACEHDLAGYKHPRDWRVVDELPRDPTGKLLRSNLRAELWPDDQNDSPKPRR